MSKMKKKQNEPKEISEKDLKTALFVPMKRMKEVLSYIDLSAPPRNTERVRCDYNLMYLKHERSNREYYDESKERYSSVRHKSLFVSSCYKALYAHDWDRLLYILKRVPRWRFDTMFKFHTRMLTILLMYHPDCQKKGYFNEYLHMVWGCRTDQDKKAILKTILTLSKRMFRSTAMNFKDVKQTKKDAAKAMDNEEEDD